MFGYGLLHLSINLYTYGLILFSYLSFLFFIIFLRLPTSSWSSLNDRLVDRQGDCWVIGLLFYQTHEWETPMFDIGFSFGEKYYPEDVLLIRSTCLSRRSLHLPLIRSPTGLCYSTLFFVFFIFFGVKQLSSKGLYLLSPIWFKLTVCF